MDPKRIFKAADAIALECGGIEHVTLNAVRRITGGRKDTVSVVLTDWRNERRKFKKTMPDTLLTNERAWMEEIWVLAYIAGHQAAGSEAQMLDGISLSVERTPSGAGRSPKVADTVPCRPHPAVPGHRSTQHEGFLKSRGLLKGARHSETDRNEDRVKSTVETARSEEARTPEVNRVQPATARKLAAPDVAVAPLQPRDVEKVTRLTKMSGREREAFLAELADEMERVLKNAKYPLASSEVFRRIESKLKIFPASKALATFMEAARDRLPKIFKNQWVLPEVTIVWQPKNKSEISPTVKAQSRRDMKAAFNRAMDLLGKAGTPMTAEDLFQMSAAAEDFSLRWFKWALNDRRRRGKIAQDDDGKYKMKVNVQSR